MHVRKIKPAIYVRKIILAFYTKNQPHMSTRYLAYCRRTIKTRLYASVGVDNWLVIKGTEFKLRITDIRPNSDKTSEKQCDSVYINRQQGMNLYDATVQLDGTVPIKKDPGSKSTKLTSDVDNFKELIKAEITCKENLITMQKINVLHINIARYISVILF